jgi:hypothetical protein
VYAHLGKFELAVPDFNKAIVLMEKEGFPEEAENLRKYMENFGQHRH